MLTGILLVLAGLIAGLLIAVARLPASMQMQRSVLIHAPAANVFPFLDELKASEQWSPFLQVDPAMKKTYSGPASGPGAQLDFDGDRKHVGSGRIAVTARHAPTRVVLRLQMFAPLSADNVVTFTALPLGENLTEVTWAMSGPQPLLMRLMALLFRMDAAVGVTFENGLQNLKTLVEKR